MAESYLTHLFNLTNEVPSFPCAVHPTSCKKPWNWGLGIDALMFGLLKELHLSLQGSRSTDFHNG